MMTRRALASWLYLGTTTLCGFLLLAVTSRYMPADQAGLWFTMQTSASFVVLAELGTSYALMRETAQSIGRSGHYVDDAGLQSCYSRADVRKIALLLAISLGLACAIGLSFLAYFLFVPSSAGGAGAALAWLCYLAFTLFNIAALPKKAFLEANGCLTREKVITTGTHIVGVLLSALGAIGFQSLVAMALGQLASSVLAYAIMCRATKDAWGNAQSPSLLSAGIGDTLREGLGVFWINIGAVATKSAYAPITTWLLGAASLAPVFLAAKVFAIVSTAVNVLIMSERALISRDLATGAHQEVSTRFVRILKINAFSSICLGVGVVIGLKLLTSRVIDPEYELPDILYVLFFVDLIFNNVSAACGHFVLAAGRNPFKLSVPASGVVTVLLLIVLLPTYGVLGAVIAPLIAGTCSSYWFNIYCAYRLIKARDGDEQPNDRNAAIQQA